MGKREDFITVLFNNAGCVPFPRSFHSILLIQFPASRLFSTLTGGCEMPSAASAEAYRRAVFDNVTEEDFDQDLKTNALGPYWLTFAFLPLLERWKTSQGGARFAPQVIMTSSINGWTKVCPLPLASPRRAHNEISKDISTSGFSFPYLFSKAAIGQATSALAHELLPLGIRVNGIAPGIFATGMTTGPDAADSAGISHFPKDRTDHGFAVPVTMRPGHGSAASHGTNRDMGAVVLALVANWYVCGETVLIDGGVGLSSSWGC